MFGLQHVLAAAVTLAAPLGAQDRHAVGQPFEGLPTSAAPQRVYASTLDHPLNRLHALLFLAERQPTEIGHSLPSERSNGAQGDAEFFQGKWYFRNRSGAAVSAADIRVFGGDVRISPVEDLRGQRGEALRTLLEGLDTRTEVEAIPELRAPLARVLLQWDLLSVWWRIERETLDGAELAAEEATLRALGAAIRALALPSETLRQLSSGTQSLAPRGDGSDRARPYVPSGLLAGERGAWREIARDEKELFHARNSLRAARVFVRAADGAATEELVRKSAAATDEASTPKLEIGTEAALVLSLVVLDETLTPFATSVVDEVRVRRVTGPAELRPDNGSSRDGWSHWIFHLSRSGALLGEGERFRFVPDTAQSLFLEYGTPKYTTYFAQCALCHRRTNSGGQDPDGIRALGRYGHPALEDDAQARWRIAAEQFEPIAAALRSRLAAQ